MSHWDKQSKSKYNNHGEFIHFLATMPLNAAGTLRNRYSHHEKKIGQCDRLIIRTVQEMKICEVSSELCISKRAIQCVLALQA